VRGTPGNRRSYRDNRFRRATTRRWAFRLVRNHCESVPDTFFRLTLDLAKTPWLTWRLLETGLKGNGYAVKVTDVESSCTVTLTEMYWSPFHDYRAYDLRKLFDAKAGVRTFQVKFYYMGLNYLSATKCETAKKGDYLAVEFLRAEAD
jgi:hypothetical protein